MPLYVYRCSACHQEQIALRSITKRDEASVCETCGEPVTRAMTAPAQFSIAGGGTRNHNRLKYWPLEKRLEAQYGDNP